jgi:hypothetical protein
LECHQVLVFANEQVAVPGLDLVAVEAVNFGLVSHSAEGSTSQTQSISRRYPGIV